MLHTGKTVMDRGFRLECRKNKELTIFKRVSGWDILTKKQAKN